MPSRNLLRTRPAVAGTSPRPLIAYAPGTQGQGDRCAPSRAFLGHPLFSLRLLLPCLDGSAVVGILRYVLRGVFSAYPEVAGPLTNSALAVLLAEQRIGRLCRKRRSSSTATVLIRWCRGRCPSTQSGLVRPGADVEFWTNERPPLFNKLAVNHALALFVEGERAMQWIADRFNGLPTTPNCGQFS